MMTVHGLQWYLVVFYLLLRNYNSDANIDDGSCNYDCEPCPAAPVCDPPCPSGPIYGCTDELACNYNESADIEDGSCIYFGCEPCDGCPPVVVFGCTYAGACNYNPSATVNDGSCDFCCIDFCPDEGCTDPEH